MKYGGRAFVGASAGYSVYNIATSDNKVRTSISEASGWTMSLAMASDFALIGGAVGGPPGAIIAGIIGGGAGYIIGSSASEIIYDDLND